MGKRGRFANQIFQYAFLKIYAKKHNLQVETPKWIGRELFGCDDVVCRRDFPSVRIPNDSISFVTDLNLHHEQPLTNTNIRGYFQYHTKSYVEYKNYFRSLFQPVPNIISKLGTRFEQLKEKADLVVGLHIRRGDFGFDQFFLSPSEWYKEWLDSFWDKLKNPVLFIASDEANKVVKDFVKYNPITVKDLDVDLEFFNQSKKKACYPDFYFLTQCDKVAVSNSSFSFAACMLNEVASVFVRPRLSLRKLILFDPWNAPPMFRDERVEDYE